MKSHILKIISIIVLILGIIGSIVYGVIYQNELDDLIDSIPKDTIVSGFTIAVIGIVSTLLLFIILLTASAMLEHLENVDRGFTQIISERTKLEFAINSNDQPSKVNLASRYWWVCSNCKELNSKDSTVCKKCGKIQ